MYEYENSVFPCFRGWPIANYSLKINKCWQDTKKRKNRRDEKGGMLEIAKQFSPVKFTTMLPDYDWPPMYDI